MFRKGFVKSGRINAKRHEKDNRIKFFSKLTIRKLARRGGIQTISEMVYNESCRQLIVFLNNVIRDSIENTEREKRNTVTLNGVINVLKRQGQTIRGFNK